MDLCALSLWWLNISYRRKKNSQQSLSVILAGPHGGGCLFAEVSIHSFIFPPCSWVFSVALRQIVFQSDGIDFYLFVLCTHKRFSRPTSHRLKLLSRWEALFSFLFISPLSSDFPLPRKCFSPLSLAWLTSLKFFKAHCKNVWSQYKIHHTPAPSQRSATPAAVDAMKLVLSLLWVFFFF